MGPLDYITGIAFITIGSWAFACIKGYPIIATSILGTTLGLAYLNAPSRFYPTSEQITENVDLTGKVAVVTGATSGIGIETARVLVLRGAHVFIAARNPKKLEATRLELISNLPSSCYYEDRIHILPCDLEDLQSVKHAAKSILSSPITKMSDNNKQKLDILINNAGIMAVPSRTETKQGLESQVGVNHVGHFYLTKLLLPAIQNSEDGRIVCLSSSAHAYHDITNLLSSSSSKLETDPYDHWVAYGNSKCANMLHAKALTNTKYNGGSNNNNITAYSVNPGGIHTGLQVHVGWYIMFQWAIVTPFFFKSIPQGAATTLLCATSKKDKTKVVSGEYHDNCMANPMALEKVLDVVGKDAPDRLWEVTEKILKDAGFD